MRSRIAGGGGDPTTRIVLYDRSDATVPNGSVPIKATLAAALKTFRSLMQRHDARYFWIDAICINQDDNNNNEKSSQIGRMAAIYTHAGQVRVWLGTATPDTAVAMAFVHDLSCLDDLDQLCQDDGADHKWAAFRELMRSEWFNRRWIIQEIALARAATVYCGRQTVSWEGFKGAVSLFLSREHALRRLFHQSRACDHNANYLGDLEALGAKVLVDTSDDLFRRNESGQVIEHLLSLEALMATLVMFEASTPHDTVYAILGLAHDATPASRRPAARSPEHGRPPLGSPVMASVPSARPIQFIPAVEPADGTRSASPAADHAPSAPGASPTHGAGARRPPAAARPGSGSHAGAFLTPDAQGRPGRARANSLTSLRRAKRPYEEEAIPLVVDYGKSTYDVCTDFVEFVVRRSQSLDILCVPWAPSPATDRGEGPIPSWIPHLSGRPFELRPREKVYSRVNADPLVGTPGRGVRRYRVCGKTKAHHTDTATWLIVDGALATSGFILDVMDTVAAEATGGIIPSSWMDLVGVDAATDALPQHFWRTIVADGDLGGRKQPPAYFLLACKWAFDRRPPGFHLDTRPLLHEGRCPKEAARFLRRVQAVIWDRKLGLTYGTGGAAGTEPALPLLALVPTITRTGDLVCVLHGCSVPAVLRKTERRAAPAPEPPRTVHRPPPPVSRQDASGMLRRHGTTTTSSTAAQPARRADSPSPFAGDQYIFLGGTLRARHDGWRRLHAPG